MQSTRCAVATRRATLATAVASQTLDEFERWSTQVESSARMHAPMAEVWLGETGNAQCGGQPGVSDAFAGSFWWLDELGRAARHGEQVVIRQTLAGANYGLLDAATLTPRPDYWNSLLWHQTMGSIVLDAQLTSVVGDVSTVRSYAHCTPGTSGAVTVLLIQPTASASVGVMFDSTIVAGAMIYRVSADSLDATTLRINGATLALHADGTLPVLEGVPVSDASMLQPLVIAPQSYVFVTLPAASAAACR
jgi:heparanase 1